MTRNLNSFIALALAMFAIANNASADFKITAAPRILPASAELTLARHDVDERSTKGILTAKTANDGSLSLDIAEEAGIFILKIDGGSDLTLAVEDGETIELLNSDGTLVATGSPSTQILNNYESFRKESLARLVYPTRKDIKEAKARRASEEEIVALTQAEVDAYEAHLHELNDFVIKNAGSTMALYGASLRLKGDYRTTELAGLVNAFASEHGDISASRSLQSRIDTSLRVALGQIAPDLSAKNLEEKSESLSDYRGQYVLLDFWASWCPPCRLENKHYAKLVEKINSDRFTIFAVNLDTSEKAWSRAVARDNANWVNVSDLKGWKSPLPARFGVSALPASFLLDPDGRIVAKNLRGAALDAKLKELGLL